MKLFTLGPVEMYPHTLEIAARQVPYFRTSEFSETMKENTSLLKKLSNASEYSEVIYLTASGTAAMEAVVVNSFDESDNLLIVDGGSFGHRFTEICKYHGIPFESIKLSFGESLAEEKLNNYDGKDFTGFLVNIHETSTGQLYDIKSISEFCKRNDLYLVVDAISAFLADEVDIAKYNIDALIISSQKALALSPGLSIVILDSKLLSQKISNIKPKMLYFDFGDYVKNGKRGQTPYTPAVRVLLELNDMLQSVDAAGVDTLINKTSEIAHDFRERMKDLPHVTIPKYPLSNACTLLIFESGGAEEINRRLIEEYDIYVNPNGGDLSDKVLRVGHIGNIGMQDNAILVDALRKIGL